MPHIPLPPLPGMPALGTYRPDIYAHLAALADLLLHQPHPDSTLAPADRELIVTYVSSLNQCEYCTAAHLCVSSREVEGLLGQTGEQENGLDLTPKMRAILKIAAAVTVSGKNVSKEIVEEAKKEGASDMDVHDTVLIAAAFCMFNRYVDGLGTEMPGNLGMFEKRGARLRGGGTWGLCVGGSERGGLGSVWESGKGEGIQRGMPCPGAGRGFELSLRGISSQRRNS